MLGALIYRNMQRVVRLQLFCASGWLAVVLAVFLL